MRILLNLLRLTAFKYLLIGGLGALLELFLFSYFMSRHISIFISNALAFHLAFIVCFTLHQCYTYRDNSALVERLSTKKLLTRFFLYAMLMYAQFFLGSLLLDLLIESFKMPPWGAKILQIVIVTPVGYVVQKKIIFHHKHKMLDNTLN